VASGRIGNDETCIQGCESARYRLGNRISENVVWYVVRSCAQRLELDHLALMTSGEHAQSSAM
jgi:hypothetical protein